MIGEIPRCRVIFHASTGVSYVEMTDHHCEVTLSRDGAEGPSW